jgi:hypothetical protein
MYSYLPLDLLTMDRLYTQPSLEGFRAKLHACPTDLAKFRFLALAVRCEQLPFSLHRDLPRKGAPRSLPHLHLHLHQTAYLVRPMF